MEFFQARARPPVGDRRLDIRMGSVRLGLAGLDEDLEGRLRERFAVYIDPDPVVGERLSVDVRVEDQDYFIDPPERPEFNPVLIACDGPRVRYLGYRVAGWFDIGPGRGELLLGHGSLEPPQRAMENYIRASVAWFAASLGGALVHAAGAVWKGKGFLFYGESGAGKSTLSEVNRRARVVSDDLSLVLPGAEGPELVGSPFRGTYEEGQPVVGRFPIAAGFRIVKDSSAEVRPVIRARAMAELVGNLPFVAEAFHKRPDLFERLERAFDGLPLAHLHFRKDESYWDAIERAGLAG
jgi:hypothetical protein